MILSADHLCCSFVAVDPGEGDSLNYALKINLPILAKITARISHPRENKVPKVAIIALFVAVKKTSGSFQNMKTWTTPNSGTKGQYKHEPSDPDAV